jgi:hypothetical protein
MAAFEPGSEGAACPGEAPALAEGDLDIDKLHRNDGGSDRIGEALEPGR